MRCPDCNKFVGLNFEEVEEPELEIDDTGNVTGEVRLVRTCSDCGQELKEATLYLESNEAAEAIEGKHDDEGHDLSVEVTGTEPIEEGGGRYAKSFFGATIQYDVNCSCQEDGKPIFSGEMSDKVPASGMDELV